MAAKRSPPTPVDAQFEALKRTIREGTRLDCSSYKDTYLKRRLQVRLRATGCDNYWEYQRYLRDHPGEFAVLTQTLTINVTQFFRDAEVYQALADLIIPEIAYMKSQAGRRVIRVWSAGCSTGEEPWSLAVLFHRVLGSAFHQYMVSIHGTDIDEVCLQKAKAGVYPSEALEGIGGALLRPYTTPVSGGISIQGALRSFVRFTPLDLMAGGFPSNFDLILNRNVMIYFGKEQQDQLVERFHDALNDGGFLVLGKTEGLSSEMRSRFELVDPKRRIYRKAKRDLLKEPNPSTQGPPWPEGRES